MLKVHREEKQARMQSAAILAQQTKDAARSEASPGSGGATAAVASITTLGARVDEDDRIFLHDNPLKSTPEILCPTCRLPRLQYPTMGRGARPKDPTKEYCARQPFVEREGCDIYGKSLVPEKGSKKKQKAEDKKGSRSGSDSDTPANGREEKSKPATQSMPSGKCPYCPRYMAFTRIAQHMDRCLKSQQRQTNSAANSQGGAKKDPTGKLAAAETPRSGSRASTPKPGSTTKTDAESSKKDVNGKKRKLDVAKEEDDAEDATPVKKKKFKKEKDRVKDGTPGRDDGASGTVVVERKEKKDKTKAEKKLPDA